MQGLCKASFRLVVILSDVIYDKIFNESLLKKFESAQYNAALAITGTIRGTNNVKLSGIGFRVQNRRKLRR